MAFNTSGVFLRLRNWVADANAGVKIRADLHDTEDDGFATGLSECITRSGLTTITENIPWNSKRITGLADPVNAQDAATKAYADTKLSMTGGGSITGDLYVTGNVTASGSGVFSGAMTVSGNIVTGGELTVNTGGTNVGVIRFGSSTTGTYLYWDGTQYTLAGGPLNLPSDLSLNGNITALGGITTNNLDVGGAGNFGSVGTASLQVTGTSSFTGAANFNSTIVAGNTIYGLNGITSRAPNSGSNASFNLQTETGVTVGSVNWIRNSNALRIIHQNISPNQVLEIDGSGRALLAKGILGKDTRSDTFSTQYWQMVWNGSSNFNAFAGPNYVGDFAFVSDYRIKRNVLPLPGMWDTVKKLNPIKYNNKDYTPEGADEPLVIGSDDERWGFIAHELQDTLVKHAASGSKDEANCLQSPNVLPVVAALTKALQEAMARIEALEGRS